MLLPTDSAAGIVGSRVRAYLFNKGICIISKSSQAYFNGTVLQWLAMSPHNMRVPGLNLPHSWGLSGSFHVLPVTAQVLSRYFPQSKGVFVG